MLEVVIRSTGGYGKTTLAAIIAKALSDLGMPVALHDGDHPEEALLLMQDRDRLSRNAHSIAVRETLVGARIAIRTQPVAPTPRGSPSAVSEQATG